MTSKEIIELIQELIIKARDKAVDKNTSHIERVSELDKIIAYQILLHEINKRNAVGDNNG